MNYEQTTSIKELAAPVNKVLEGLTVKGINPLTGDTLNILWKWQPQPGEWCIRKTDDNLGLLIDDNVNIHSGEERWGIRIFKFKIDVWEKKERLPFLYVPILDWEVIEGILEKAGIGFNWFYPASGVEIEMWYVEDNPNQDPCVIYKLKGNESRQEAVMKAVIKLGKEIEK